MFKILFSKFDGWQEKNRLDCRLQPD